MAARKYSTTNLPPDKTLVDLVSVGACIGGWPPHIAKVDRVKMIRMELVDGTGSPTLLGEQIIDFINTVPIAEPVARRYWRQPEAVHVSWSADGTVWYYRDTDSHYGGLKYCLAIDFGLIMFGVPSCQR